MTAAHGGGHGRGLPGLAPIRNSSELRGLCCRSCFGPRTCGRSITNSSKRAGLSIRVSPSHPYNAGRAGLGWWSGWLQRNVYTACSGCVVVLALRELVAWEFSVRRPRGGPSVILLSRVHMSVDALYFLLSWNDEVHAVLCTPRTRTRKPTHAHTHTHAYAHLQLVQADRSF